VTMLRLAMSPADHSSRRAILFKTSHVPSTSTAERPRRLTQRWLLAGCQAS
jgi:hypothetical protein